MGYESSGSGVFMVRPGLSRADAVEALEKTGFSFQSSFELLRISFTGDMSNHMEEDFAVVLKNFNGEFEVSGDEPKDLWKLVFQGGKIFKRTSKILWSEPEELERLDKIWK